MPMSTTSSAETSDTAAIRAHAHQEATRLELAKVAEKLQTLLGQQLTAFAVGVNDPRTIGKYARGETLKPSLNTERRLRELYEIVQVLLVRETAETVRAWLIGAHPLLDDHAPIELLHEETFDPVKRTAAADGAPIASFRPVVRAAEAFITTTA